MQRTEDQTRSEEEEVKELATISETEPEEKEVSMKRIYRRSSRVSQASSSPQGRKPPQNSWREMKAL